MEMTAVRSGVLPITANRAFALLQRSDTLVQVVEGMVTYDNARKLPEFWEVGATVNLRPRRGKQPATDHFVTFTHIDPRQQLLVTEESGGFIKRWHHRMELKSVGDTSCVYTDRIVIDAGWRTPFVWLWAQRFYRHRHQRWLELLARNEL